MAARSADRGGEIVRGLELLPCALGAVGALGALGAARGSDGFPAEPEARSYLPDGRMVRWRPRPVPPGAFAVDAEPAGARVPRALAARTGVTDPAEFWPLWTAVEVACKLRDVPVLRWLIRFGLRPDPGLPVRTVLLPDPAGPVVVSLGQLPPSARTSAATRSAPSPSTRR